MHLLLAEPHKNEVPFVIAGDVTNSRGNLNVTFFVFLFPNGAKQLALHVELDYGFGLYVLAVFRMFGTRNIHVRSHLMDSGCPGDGS